MIRIILADDHRMFLDGLYSILSSEPNIDIVGMAENGVQLIYLVDQYKPDLILTDIRMPVKDGISTTRFIRSKYPDMLIMVISMLDQIEDIRDILKAGASGYIPKSTNRDELVKAINEMISTGKYLSPEIASRINESDQALEYEETSPKLTYREREILFLIAEGKNSRYIASALHISKFTVDTHRKNIHRKLKIRSNTGLVRYVWENLRE